MEDINTERYNEFLLAYNRLVYPAPPVASPEPNKRWIEQCAAAERIRNRFGLQNALEYLVGEKFLNMAVAANRRPELQGELAEFLVELSHIFSPQEIDEYLGSLRYSSRINGSQTDERMLRHLYFGTTEPNRKKYR
jgi:hypothetical protein